MTTDLTPRPAIVPESEIFTVPACPTCGTAFAHEAGAWHQRDCVCDAGSGMYRGGRLWGYTQSPPIELIGQCKGIYCMLCHSDPLTAGEQAIYGMFQPYSYIGYAHTACYKAQQAEIAQAQAEAQAAATGVAVSVWFGPDAATVPAPATGHADAQPRPLPAEAPPLPAGAVVYEDFRRPISKIRVAFPDRAAADIWWGQAIARGEVAYELFWFEAGAESASREWRGRGFSAVETQAKLAELGAYS